MEPAELTRRQLLGAGAALVAAGAAPDAIAATKKHKPRPPNVVVILVDDLGYGGLGSYGQRIIQTPELDRLAGEGMRFTNGYAAAPMCAPSRCCLLTGMHNGHARVRDNSFNDTRINPKLRPRTRRSGRSCAAPDTEPASSGSGASATTMQSPETPIGVGLCGPRRARKPLQQPTAPDPSHPLQKGFDEFVGLITHNGATEGYYPDYLWDGNRRVALPTTTASGAAPTRLTSTSTVR